MAGSDLTAPLGLDKGKRLFRLPYGLIGIAVITLLVTTGAIWVSVVDDPFGGEPSAEVALSQHLDGISQKDIGVVDMDMAQADGADPKAQATEAANTFTAPASLPSAPIPALAEAGRYGLLPQIGEDGTRPVDAYARPVSPLAARQARVAIVLSGVGQSEAVSNMAIADLPADITLALSPYGDDLITWMKQARDAGHELLMQAPLEPFDYPNNDPGPHSLLIGASAADNLDKLEWVLAQSTNYVGIVNAMGGRFMAKQKPMEDLLAALRARGLMFMDDGSAATSIASKAAKNFKLPFAKADLVVDSKLSSEAITAQLMELESIARRRGYAVASATAFPLTVRELAKWSEGLEARGLALVPVSALATDPNIAVKSQ
ncbi:divergent polysaccharide deacetylase family protein [Polycladidibacter hongkongensis]|uniref:divergent polysaccharide deacetylase family protein n=1 Tax=Polycladidibacter hongkongensis TaxID=1647556 RepID=UPI00082C0D35|nr:divergent polysaccharide deacetylase family protein [Pseudovibrio hongkongensis]